MPNPYIINKSKVNNPYSNAGSLVNIGSRSTYQNRNGDVFAKDRGTADKGDDVFTKNKYKVSTVSTSYQIKNTDDIVVADTASITVTFPDATEYGDSRVLKICNASGGTVNLSGGPISTLATGLSAEFLSVNDDWTQVTEGGGIRAILRRILRTYNLMPSNLLLIKE